MTAPVQHPMYIDGQFVSGRGDGWIDVLNPATEALLSRIPDGTAEEARLTPPSAQPGWEALPAIEWAGCAKLPPYPPACRRDRRADCR
ncbi:hypothetical protein MJ579_13490 [Klebsiella pneumoniae]|nr:hypothetical protein MJ579_13490 [Klebsiella pneumoniae]